MKHKRITAIEARAKRKTANDIGWNIVTTNNYYIESLECVVFFRSPHSINAKLSMFQRNTVQRQHRLCLRKQCSIIIIQCVTVCAKISHHLSHSTLYYHPQWWKMQITFSITAMQMKWIVPRKQKKWNWDKKKVTSLHHQTDRHKVCPIVDFHSFHFSSSFHWSIAVADEAISNEWNARYETKFSEERFVPTRNCKSH